MSGGLPPATAVASTVGRLSPTGLYFTWTFGYVLLKRLMTSWNCFWPDVDVQMPSKVIVPFSALTCDPFACELVVAPASPAARSASTAANPTTAMRVRFM